MNLLIIDDERTILGSIYAQLCGMNLGMERIDTANSTEEARELMKHHFYDIYLCDIVMPEEDGIAFARRVLKQNSRIKFIFLTAHADYNYMKAAISMQSFDYLLQPASPDELYDVVQRAIAQINIERKNEELIRTGAFFAGEEGNLLEEGAWKYLSGISQKDTFCRRLIASHWGETEKEDICYMPILIQVLQSEKDLENMDKTLLRSIYHNIMREILDPMGIGCILILNGKQGDFAALLRICWEHGTERAHVLEKMEILRAFFKKLIMTTIAVYCGEFCSYRELQNGFQKMILAQKNNVHKDSRVFSSLSSRNITVNYSFEAQIAPWKKLLERKQFSDFYQSVASYIENYSSKTSLNRDYMVKLHRAMTELILGYIVNSGIDSDQIFDMKMPYLFYMDSWREVPVFLDSLHYICERLQFVTGTSETDVIEKTIKYIQQNVGDVLLVSELAEQVCMNPEYFTKLFKKKTGCNLKEFIDNEKMDTAKMLLLTTNLSVTMVADHVGYNDYNSFTRRFKQVVGCTPMDFRKSEGQKLK